MIATRHCITSALRPILRSQPLSAGKVRFAWAAAVGRTIDQATVVALGTDGTLTVTTTDRHWSREVGRSSPLIASRMNELLGDNTIARINIATAPAR